MSKASLQICPAAYVCLEELECEDRHDGKQLRQSLAGLISSVNPVVTPDKLTITELENLITDVDDDDERDMLETFAAEIRDRMNDFLGEDQQWGDFDVIFHSH